MNNQVKTIAELPKEVVKDINLFLTCTPHSLFSEVEISHLNTKSDLYPFIRGSLLSDELLLIYGLMQNDHSKQFIQDEIEAFKKNLVESDYSTTTHKEVIDNELYRIKSQICRYAVVLLSDKPSVAQLLLLCDQYLPIAIKTVEVIPNN